MMKFGAALMTLMVTAWVAPPHALAGSPPPAPGIERSSLFQFADGDRLEDAGVITVTGGPFARTEAFEVVRRTDGGRTITSVTTGSGGAYRVEGRWTYDAAEKAQAAQGLGRYGDQPVSVDIRVVAPQATIAAQVDGAERTVNAPCNPCLVDLSPSALPMFTMTRLYDAARDGVQSFDWIGRGLIQDSVLTEGRAALHKVRSGQVPGPDGTPVAVDQYHFVETLMDPGTGRVIRYAFNLYVDGTQRPLGFAMGTGTAGLRSGFDDLTPRMPPVVDAAATP